MALQPSVVDNRQPTHQPGYTMIQLLLNGQVLVFSLILFCLILSLTFHEYGHGIMAKWYGDSTAEDQGRLTLNPLAHLDPLGLLMVVFIGFGYAKPVPTDPRNYRSRWGVLSVAAAGPLMNLILAVFTINLYAFGYAQGWELFQGAGAYTFFIFLASINMLLMVFNLIPIGPLDGHYILPYFLPENAARRYIVLNHQYGSWVLLSLIVLAVIGIPIFQHVWSFAQFLLGLLVLF
jgi:Zn-dependent protease